METSNIRPAAILGRDVLPPPTIDPKPGTAVVKAEAPQLPAVIERPRGVTLIDLTAPVAAGSGWLAAIFTASTLGAGTPALLALGAGAVASAIALGKGIVDRAREKVVVSAPAARPVKKAEPEPVTSNESVATALRMALDQNNAWTLRVERAESYAREAQTVSGFDCEVLLRTLPRGVKWGFQAGKTMPHLSVFPTVGLSTWTPAHFEPCDVSAVVLCLSKLGPVTDAQRKSILTNAMAIVTNTTERDAYYEKFRGELDACVRELVARAPKAAEG